MSAQHDPVDLTDQEWVVLQAIRDRKTPNEIAALIRTSRQNVDNVRRRLIAKGVIQRVGDIPWWMAYTEEYPLRVDDGRDVRYRPALPPKATFRASWPTDSTEDLSVIPIRVARWPVDSEGDGGWVVQGLGTVDPRGRHPLNVIPDHRVVWCVSGYVGKSTPVTFPGVLFLVSINQCWAESHTVEVFRNHGVELSRRNMAGLTLMISAVVAVQPLHDITGREDGETDGD